MDEVENWAAIVIWAGVFAWSVSALWRMKGPREARHARGDSLAMAKEFVSKKYSSHVITTFTVHGEGHLAQLFDSQGDPLRRKECTSNL